MLTHLIRSNLRILYKINFDIQFAKFMHKYNRNILSIVID